MVENKVTGEVLKCIVIVDTVQHIEIETTTRLLYLEDSPEEMMVRGYDAEGNVFSSLQGLEFQWSLQSDTSGSHADIVDAHSILRILKFSDSYITTPHHIARLEERGHQGDIILVEGVRTGSAFVRAKLIDLAFEGVAYSSVRLMVIANLIITPPEAYVLKDAMVKYKVEQIRQNSFVAISMPSTQYYLEVVDGVICSLDASTSVGTALQLGETEVKLIDKNIKSTDVSVQPTAIIHVVSPSYLGFTVLPDRKWVLETGRQYIILIDIYDKHSHKLYPSENVIIESIFQSVYFDVLYSTKNGSYHVVKTLQKGDTNIDGSLNKVLSNTFFGDLLMKDCGLMDGPECNVSPPVKQTQFVEIFEPIHIHRELLFFPWDPIKQASHTYKLKVSGGSGDYMWSSNNADVVTVNKYGEISTSSVGEAEVTAADRRNTLHKGLAKIHVLPPSDMVYKPDRVEVEVGSVLDLPLDVMATLNGRKHSFVDCRKMPINVTFSDRLVVQYVDDSSDMVEGSCRIIKVKGLQQGHTNVKVTYKHSGGVQLESTITIAAYDPLVPVEPEKESVVALGSSKEVIFAGGPQPWVLDSSKYFQILKPEDASHVLIDRVKTVGLKKLHSFIVTCKTYGDLTLPIHVGNDKTAKNQNPAVAQASVNFICAEPVEMHVEPKIEYPKGLPPCPVSREPNVQIPVHSRRDLNIAISVTDKNGRRFDNISSIEFEWSLSDDRVASLPFDLETESTTGPSGKKHATNTMLLRPGGVAASLVLSVSASKYKKAYLTLAQSRAATYISPSISKSVDLKLVDEAMVSPHTLSVFNHPSNKVKFDVAHGSGYFHVLEGKAGVVSLKYAEKTKQIQVVPLTDGQMTVTVYDLCVVSSQPAQVTIRVSGVGSVQLYATDKVEVGKEITGRVQVLDATGEKLYASFFTLMELTLETGSDIITLKRDETSVKDEYSALYTIHGAVVGHTSLKAVANLPDKRIITSLAKPVEVFPPLELIPRNITIIIGALFQVLSRGGPRPQSTVVYSIRNKDVSLVSSSGLLDGQSLGTTRVIGQAVGTDPESGETIVYSEDEVTVNVIRLAGIRIHAPLTRLQSGTTMPVYAVGLTEHETPFTFGSSIPPLSFTWTLNKDVAQLKNVFHESGIQPGAAGHFASQLVAMETGDVSVSLEVTAKAGYNQVFGDGILRDQLQIQVFEELQMIRPTVCDGQLLMTPNTEALLKTNRDGGASMLYKVLGGSADIVRVEDGVLISGSNTGQVALHVTAIEESGVTQTLVLMVKVKAVSYLMINSDSRLRSIGGQLSCVPRGATLHYTVTYHDDMGQKFYATNIDMKFRCSRYDLVQASHGLDNNTIVMKASTPGNTVLKVWDSGKPWLVDYINVPVDNVIEPVVSSLTLASIVCFTAPLATQSGVGAMWRGSGSLGVDARLGVANANTVGAGSITYSVTDDVMTSTEVTVEAVSRVSLEFGSEFITSVTTESDNVYHVFVNLDDVTAVQGSNCVARVSEESYQPVRIPFTCQLSINSASHAFSQADLFAVKPVFVSKVGRYACQITAQSQHGVTAQVSTVELNVQLTATVIQLKGQGEVQSAPLSLPYLPAFYLHNMEIHVSSLSPVSSVRISTTAALAPQLQVVVSDPSILEALAPEVDSQSPNILIYPIKLLDTVTLWEREQLDVWVNLIGQKTGQNVKIPVFIRLIGQKPSGAGGYRETGWRAVFLNLLNNYQSWFLLLIIIFITAVTVIIGYHIIYGSRYKAAAGGNTSAYMNAPSGSPVHHMQGSPPPVYTPYGPPQTPKSPMLWSTGYTPLDGNTPSRRRSPIQRISPS